MSTLLLSHIGMLATPTGRTAKAGRAQGEILTLSDAWVYAKDGRITAELFVDRTLIPDLSAAWRIVSPINRSLASFKQIGEIVLRETEFEKTATRKIKRYKLKGC